MKFSMKQFLAASAVAIALSLVVWFGGTPAAAAQYSGQGQQPQAQPAPKPASPGQAAPPAQAEAPKLNPEEEESYKKFFDLKPEDTDKLIQLGEGFLKKYPTSHYRNVVYSRLAQAYFAKQDMDKMFASGDKALQLNPDDVAVLSLVGWVLPHNYNPNDLDADKKLDLAEQYTKRALELLATMPKPENLTDDAFAKARSVALSHSHSGLGLVYFRRGQYAESIAELQQATQLVSDPDQTDFFVTGIDLEQLKRFADAATAFQHCSELSGELQERCKQSMDQAKRMAATEAPKKP